MKKIVSLTLVLAMVCALFAGCGSKPEAPAAAAPAATQTAASSEAPAEETLTVWCWDENFNLAAMRTAEKYYKAAGHENFTLNVVNVAEEDIQTRMTTAFAAGVTDELPDIVLLGDSCANMYLSNYMGCYVDLTDYIDFSEFASYKVSCFTVDGRVYGVPFDSGSAGLFYRTDILEAAGYTEADMENITLQDMLEMAKVIHEKTGKFGFEFDPSSGCAFTWIDSFQQASGEWFYPADDAEENADFANNKVIREVCEFLKEAWNNDLVYRTDSRDSSGISAIQAGEVAFVPNAIWYGPSLTAAEDASGKWSYTKFPTLTTVETSSATNIGGSSWVILDACKNQPLAIDFMKTIWAGNTDFYDEILLGQSAVATWLPATESEVYNTPIEFFSGKPLYADFASWGKDIPSVTYGTNTWTVNGAINGCLMDYIDGSVDIDGLMEEIQSAYDTMK